MKSSPPQYEFLEVEFCSLHERVLVAPHTGVCKHLWQANSPSSRVSLQFFAAAFDVGQLDVIPLMTQVDIYDYVSVWRQKNSIIVQIIIIMSHTQRGELKANIWDPVWAPKLWLSETITPVLKYAADWWWWLNHMATMMVVVVFTVCATVCRWQWAARHRYLVSGRGAHGEIVRLEAINHVEKVEKTNKKKS